MNREEYHAARRKAASLVRSARQLEAGARYSYYPAFETAEAHKHRELARETLPQPRPDTYTANTNRRWEALRTALRVHIRSRDLAARNRTDLERWADYCAVHGLSERQFNFGNLDITFAGLSVEQVIKRRSK